MCINSCVYIKYATRSTTSGTVVVKIGKVTPAVVSAEFNPISRLCSRGVLSLLYYRGTLALCILLQYYTRSKYTTVSFFVFIDRAIVPIVCTLYTHSHI